MTRLETPLVGGQRRGLPIASRLPRQEDPDVHALVGYTRLYHDWDGESCEEDFLRTLQANPDSAEGHRYYGNYLVAAGRLEEATTEFEESCRLDPLSLINSSAPPSVSSAGWKISLTVPGNSPSSPARILAAPSSTVVWTSWPQACILPGNWDT